MDAAHHDDVEATLTGAVTFGVDAYTCADYARAERDKLWRKVWQQVGRVEDLPKVGSYLTYDILDDSIVVVRSAADTFKAHHNVCMHRGRRLVDIPPGAKNVCGHKKSFVCGFHGWTYDQDGNCIHIPEKPDWQGALTPENTHLAAVNVDTWGGWIWINMDPAAQPLRQYLEPAATMLDPFRLQDMRCKWRKWLTFQCNWKVAMEAFNETYHVATTHPQFNKFGNFRGGRPRPPQQHRLRRAEGPGADQVQDPARNRSRSAGIHRRNAALHARGDQRDHHQNAGGRRAASGRGVARRRTRGSGARSLADVGTA
ncbi:Biphenyl dioxygenase subunit alpha [Mycobacterium marinum]|uniref:aromatic ring-hydroxylating oxygenase subunit alpha n=1 Tax=Mycobacterium marinum TaxID=1781 RepID=UPI000EDA9B5A|nr:Biphenyl dioxygenase subunit alpha [Mycobacterium marinum]